MPYRDLNFKLVRAGTFREKVNGVAGSSLRFAVTAKHIQAAEFSYSTDIAEPRALKPQHNGRWLFIHISLVLSPTLILINWAALAKEFAQAKTSRLQ